TIIHCFTESALGTFKSQATYTVPKCGLPGKVSTTTASLSLKSRFEKVTLTGSPQVSPPSVETDTPTALSGLDSLKSRLAKYARLLGPKATQGSEALSHGPPLGLVLCGIKPTDQV